MQQSNDISFVLFRHTPVQLNIFFFVSFIHAELKKCNGGIITKYYLDLIAYTYKRIWDLAVQEKPHCS
jgi:hypothetical protein